MVAHVACGRAAANYGKLAVGSFTRRGTLRRPLHGCCKHGQGLPGPHLLGHRRTEAKECLHSIQSSIFLNIPIYSSINFFSSIETPQSSATRPEHIVHKQYANMFRCQRHFAQKDTVGPGLVNQGYQGSGGT